MSPLGKRSLLLSQVEEKQRKQKSPHTDVDQDHEFTGVPAPTSFYQAQPNRVLSLQRTIGNKATRELLAQQNNAGMQRMMPPPIAAHSGPTIQAKRATDTPKAKPSYQVIGLTTPSDSISLKKHTINVDVAKFYAWRMTKHFEKFQKLEFQLDEVDWDSMKNGAKSKAKTEKRMDKEEEKGGSYFQKMTKEMGRMDKVENTKKIGFSSLFRDDKFTQRIKPASKYYRKKFYV